MSTYTQILYQIVFGTKFRQKVLTEDHRDELFRYMIGFFNNNNCRVYQINGVEDHVHIVTHIHQSVALSDLIKHVKLASSDFIKRKKLFTNFNSWQIGYGAFTYSIEAKDNLVAYVKNQVQHHREKTSLEEYIELLKKHGIIYDPKYLE